MIAAHGTAGWVVAQDSEMGDVSGILDDLAAFLQLEMGVDGWGRPCTATGRTLMRISSSLAEGKKKPVGRRS